MLQIYKIDLDQDSSSFQKLSSSTVGKKSSFNPEIWLTNDAVKRLVGFDLKDGGESMTTNENCKLKIF